MHLYYLPFVTVSMDLMPSTGSAGPNLVIIADLWMFNLLQNAWEGHFVRAIIFRHLKNISSTRYFEFSCPKSDKHLGTRESTLYYFSRELKAEQHDIEASNHWHKAEKVLFLQSSSIRCICDLPLIWEFINPFHLFLPVTPGVPCHILSLQTMLLIYIVDPNLEVFIFSSFSFAQASWNWHQNLKV